MKGGPTIAVEEKSHHENSAEFAEIEEREKKIRSYVRGGFACMIGIAEELVAIREKRLWVYRVSEGEGWRDYIVGHVGMTYGHVQKWIRFYERVFLPHSEFFYEPDGRTLRPIRNEAWLIEDVAKEGRPEHPQIPRLIEATQTLDRQGFLAEVAEVLEGKEPGVAEEEAQAAQMHRAKKVRERQLQERDVGNPRVWRSEKFRSWAREQPCVICGSSPCDPHHLATRGSRAGDFVNVVSLCRRHHRLVQDGHLSRDFTDDAAGLLIGYICWLESDKPREGVG